MDHILNDDDDNMIRNEQFCNAIRLCLGKKPLKHCGDYYTTSLYDFLFDKNAANDVY